MLRPLEPGRELRVRPTTPLTQDLDVEAFLDGIPEAACSKGNFINTMAGYVERRRPSALEEFRLLHPERFSIFRDVPMRVLLPSLVSAARLAHPELPLAEAVRRIGRAGYEDTLRASLLARTLLAAVGIERVLKNGARAFELFEKNGTRMSCTQIGERRYRFDYERAYVWLDAYHVGLLEGLASAFGVERDFEVSVTLRDRYRGVLECRW
jgi:uncharacterized protein (TIGR02265 family)